jgi:hypothetical protein
MQTIDVGRRPRTFNVSTKIVSLFITKPLRTLIMLFAILLTCQLLGIFKLQFHAVFLLPLKNNVQEARPVEQPAVFDEGRQRQLDTSGRFYSRLYNHVFPSR